MDPLYTEHSITRKLIWTTAITCLTTIQYGFHLAVLNAPQDILSCALSVPGPYPYSDTFWAHQGIPQCIPMTSSGIAAITTMFTLGGLLCSTVVGSHYITSTLGRRTIQKISALVYAAGCILAMFSSTITALCMSRFLCGLAAGGSMVIAPILINEISPFNHRGLMGSLLQFGVSLGVLIAQLAAFPLCNDSQWRGLFLFGALLALTQFGLLFTSVESPKWLILHQGSVTDATALLFSLRTDRSSAISEISHWRRLSNKVDFPKYTEASALIDELSENYSDSSYNADHQEVVRLFVPLSTAMSRRGSIDPSTLSGWDYIRSRRYRKEWFAIFLIMTAQQLCGMNAITFYGVSVLCNLVPEGTNVLILTSSLALASVISTFTISPLIDKWGRRPFLLALVGVMSVSSVFISWGLMGSHDFVAAGSCFLFIFGFSLGLAQIPFLMASELSSHEAIGKAQSLGTTFNWLANVIVAYLFPLLSGFFGNSVFFIFAITGVIYFIGIFIFVPETKGLLDYDEIWEKSNL